MAPVSSRRWRVPHASAAMARLGWAAVVGLAVSCNAILGLDDVRPLSLDGGTDRPAEGNGGTPAGGQTGSGSGGMGTAGVAGTGGVRGTGGGLGTGGVRGTGGGLGTGGVPGTGGGLGTGGRAGVGGAGAGDAGSGSCGRELSRNGNFELGMTSWNEAPLGTALVFRSNDPGLVADGVTAHSGQFVLRLGAPSDNFLTHYVEQYVDIPADASEVTVSGYLQIRTQETQARINDEARVVIADEFRINDPFFASTPTWSNLTLADGWTWFAFRVAVTSIAGSQMVFRIVADLDTGIPTYFYFDTVSVAVTGCSP